MLPKKDMGKEKKAARPVSIQEKEIVVSLQNELSDLKYKLSGVKFVEEQNKKLVNENNLQAVENDELRRENQFQKEQLNEIQKELSELRTEHDNLIEVKNGLDNKVGIQAVENNNLRTETLNLTERLTENQNKIEDLETKLTCLEESNSDLVSQNTQLRADLESEIQARRQNENMFKSQLEEKEQDLNGYRNDIKGRLKRIQTLRKEKSDLYDNNQEITRHLRKIQSELEENKRERESLNSSLEVLRLEKTKLEEKHEAAKHTVLLNAVEKFAEIYVLFAEQHKKIEPSEFKKRFEIAFSNLNINKIRLFPVSQFDEITLDLNKESLPELMQKFDWFPSHPFEGEGRSRAIRFRLIRRGLTANGQILLRAIVAPISGEGESSSGDTNE